MSTESLNFAARRPSFAPTASREESNNTLDSFEDVMKAMDAELARARGAPPVVANDKTAQIHKEKSKGKAASGEPADIEEAMEAELRNLMEREEVEEGENDVNEHADYHLIKNFLESYKSQGGLSGPVSNLAGRLQGGWTLPRDAS